MKPQTSTSPKPSSSTLMRRVLFSTALLVIILITAGGITAYQSTHLQRITFRHTVALNIEATTAGAMLHTYRLIATAESTYVTHNPQYIKTNVQPYIHDLKADTDHLRTFLSQTESPALQQAIKTSIGEMQKVTTLAESLLSQAQIGNWPSAEVRLSALRQREPILLTSLDNLLNAAAKYHQAQNFFLSNINRIITFVPLIMTLLGILLLISGAVIMRQFIILPLQNLEQQVRQFAEGDFSLRVPVKQRDEIGQLAHTFNLMADRIQEAHATLAEKVEERTRALQRRTSELQAATEIGRAVSIINNLDEMLQEATRLISQRYGFYHVAAFLTEENNQKAVIRAAYTQNGDAAAQLLAQQFTISLHDTTPVGQTLTSQRSVSAQFEAHKYPIPALQATRGEIAIPLKHGDLLLGILDIHTRSAALPGPEERTALQMVADLLAVAVSNIRLLQETRAALEDLRHAYEELSKKGWQRYLQNRRIVGFRLSKEGQVQPLARETATPSEEAAQTERGSNLHELRFPVASRGRAIAIAKLRRPAPWTPQEKRLLNRLAERLGSVLESARLYAEAQRRAGQLQIASEIARDASSTLDLDKLLGKAINLVRERFDFYHASVFLLDESGQYAYVKESTGEAGAQLKARRHRLAVGSASIIGQTLEKAAPVVVNDVTESKIHHFNPLLPDTRAEMGIPLQIGDEIIGALDIQSTQANAFSEEDVAVLRILADQLAIAIINARLFAETQQHLQQHRLLHQITAAAASATTVEEALRNIVESVHAIRSDEGVSLLVPDEEQPDTLRVAAWAGHHPTDPDAIARLRIPIGQSVIGRVAASGESAIINDTAAIEDYIAITPDMRSELATPLLYRGELIGVLAIESPRPNAYDEHDLEMNRTLANSLAAIIANIRLLEQVRRHSGELELLYEITSAAASHVDLSELLNDLTARLQSGLDLLHCGVVIFDENGETGTLAASASAPDAPGKGMIGTKLPLNTPTIQEARRTRKPVVCRDVEHDEAVADIRDLLRQRGTKQLIVAPLLARDQVIGTLGLDIADPNREITPSELRLLEQIAQQIATSVEVARLFQQAVRTAERERLVTEITTKMRATNDPQAILQTAVEELRKALRAQQTQIVFVDENATATEETTSPQA